MADTVEVMGILGDGEREGQILPEVFLALYPEGFFRPEPPAKKTVEVSVYPAGDAVGMYQGN